MPRTHKIDARLACLVVEEFRRRRVPFDNVLEEVGLRRVDVADPETRIPYASVLGSSNGQQHCWTIHRWDFASVHHTTLMTVACSASSF
jgi:hypothetical protein